MRTARRVRVIALTSAILATASAVALISGCSPTHVSTEPPAIDVTFEHIHALVPDGSLLVGTHEGLYRLSIDNSGAATAEGPIGGLDFDPMGFTLAAGTAYASGHPGPTTPDTFGSPNLGLIASSDLGETWTNVSLVGSTDFHGLAVIVTGDGTPQIFGLDPSKERLQRSLDGGQTWADGAQLVAREIVAVGSRLYATTPDGVEISDDAGLTFQVDAAAPQLYLLATDQSGALVGVDTSGTVWTRSAGLEWTSGGTVDGTPQALGVEGSRVYVADDRGISFTEDAGVTWTVLAIQR